MAMQGAATDGCQEKTRTAATAQPGSIPGTAGS